MIEALQIFVRGFADRKRGDATIKYLTEIGFQIKEAIDGNSDSLGGMIATDVVHQEQLDEVDPEIILNELRRLTGLDNLWIQTREFAWVEEVEYGRKEEDKHAGENAPQQFRLIGGDV